jgi:hypothetical protein
MATTRRKRTTSTQRRTKGGALTCPECGRTFTRPQGLGAHRRQAHGVLGTSLTATRRNAAAAGGRTTTSAAATTAAAGTRTSAPRKTSASARRPRAAAAAASNGDGNRPGTNRDALLKTLFPAGIPAREDLIRAIQNWLEEAERLVRMR